MRWAVVVFPGSNCDRDAEQAIRLVTGDPVDLVWHDAEDLSAYDAIVLPGGFSYGDYLRAGAIARFSPAVHAVAREAERGKPVIGICNGFQILTEAGLLPGALLANDHLQFRCEIAQLRVETNDSPFTRLYEPGEIIRIPIAHGEGRYHAEPEVLEELRRAGCVAFRYVENPNGSVDDVAGILNARRNVLGLMPHPERAVIDWMGSEDGIRMFQSIHAHVEEGRTHA
ncbi:phosphoribosylformylglycinamidine synthase subunit PurQ [Alicyclobacillus mali]|uniref:Phosphoribosylformylglycinamidine synthase subunit PurQ n=1 Tax=Alicyclobacillus mali (ex Roth et al. 2021) TaxID=1123961 RepID=A0ABS0F4A8_9BACL|nr:phosphoribosylformylglycinamidine synthase subunit PurQ [Alicyclobacillus mali (ex Roth et al. 2021)]MBF8378104.1 phosphoribosylformylglycinamidine synthase subunit PurQ [Alicyclobacillus mali (ex Roth et al. 2021)]